ncbi:hypothetical protein EGY25_11720 [Brevundimonas intermedia]|uniref:Uncharacterized protein n=1 Tax=Brevundimonas intermedia TaxID=74315 RepID=A0A4Y9RU77_9CAUL|nr:hypothetical protein [Brevundimonas intermedia]TFW12654.1 hypothetical protein EGY25_11720 [Brevundimonas intermedia]
MKLPRWIGAGVTILLVAMPAYSFWERWTTFRSKQPEVSAWAFAGEEGLAWGIALAIGAGLMLAFALNQNFDRMTKPHLAKMLPFLVAGLGLAVAATALLIWVGSAWAPLSVAAAIGLAVYAAKAAGLEPKQTPDNLPRVEG